MATFASDTFTDSDSTSLASHTPDAGGSWTAVAGTATIFSNRVFGSGGGGSANYKIGGTPASNEYDVDLDLVVVGTPGASDMGVWGRYNGSTSASGYIAQHDHNFGGFRLFKASSGSFTLLGTYSDSFSSGTRALKLEIRSASKKVYIDGVERISSADDAITATGNAGLRCGAQSSSNGRHGDNFAAADPGGGGGAANIWNLASNRDGTASSPTVHEVAPSL